MRHGTQNGEGDHTSNEARHRVHHTRDHGVSGSAIFFRHFRFIDKMLFYFIFFLIFHAHQANRCEWMTKLIKVNENTWNSYIWKYCRIRERVGHRCRCCRRRRSASYRRSTVRASAVATRLVSRSTKDPRWHLPGSRRVPAARTGSGKGTAP